MWYYLLFRQLTGILGRVLMWGGGWCCFYSNFFFLIKNRKCYPKRKERKKGRKPKFKKVSSLYPKTHKSSRTNQDSNLVLSILLLLPFPHTTWCQIPSPGPYLPPSLFSLPAPTLLVGYRLSVHFSCQPACEQKLVLAEQLLAAFLMGRKYIAREVHCV